MAAAEAAFGPADAPPWLTPMPLLDYPFELTAMAALIAASAFFSGSEAALFSITRSDRADMAKGSDQERQAASLLRRPDRLLTAILFWNLVINLTYFALTEIVAMRIGGAAGASSWVPTLFTLAALFAIILTSEVLPKSLAVLKPRLFGGLVSAPVGIAARLVDPLFPWLQSASDASARLLLPNVKQEPYLELSDLENAVDFRSEETLESRALLLQERLVLKRVVELADTTAADLMRPRRRCLVLRPPVALADLVGRMEGVGEYVLITDPDSDEIAGALPVENLALLPPDRLDRRAESVAIVPWCASAAETLNRLREEGRRVAVVVNEHGETIGIVPLEQVLDAVLRDATRADPHDAHAARLASLGKEAWEASGGTPLRRVAKRLSKWLLDGGDDPAELNQALLAARSRSVGGFLQEQLEHPPGKGDRVEAAGLVWVVSDGPTDDSDNQPLTVRIEKAAPEPPTTEGGSE